MRNGLALLVTYLALTSAASAQTSIYSSAAPPDKSALDRLNLKNEWTAFIPLDGRQDAFGSVQIVDEGQMFVQTRSGLLVALDAVTGSKQWTFRYPATYVNLYPVCVTDEFVFAVNIARLYCFNRYSGVLEFNYELPGSVTSGPIADKEVVYVTLNGTRLIAYRYPAALKATNNKAKSGDTKKPENAAEAVAARFAPLASFQGLKDDEFTRTNVPQSTSGDTGVYQGQHTPSVSVLPTITPPYTLSNRGLSSTPSVTVVPSLRQPYRLKPDFMQFNQRTPSVQSLPPSVAQAYVLANLRPRGIQPTELWIHTSTRRYMNQPVLSDNDGVTTVIDKASVSRVWLTTDSSTIEGVDKRDGSYQINTKVQDTVTAPMAGPVQVAPDKLLGFVGLIDGNVVAIDLLRGSLQGHRTEWRATVGGYMNRKPVATKDAVFAAGDQSGVAKIDMETGEMVWKTESYADRLLGLNDEFVYVRDRLGNLLIYDRKKATDVESRRSTPLAKMSVAGFNVPITNDKTDRIFLAADSGILVCLRDASSKYTKPMRLVPAIVPPAKKEEPKKDEPMAEEPKKIEPKKVEPKKDEPKKDEPKKAGT